MRGAPGGGARRGLKRVGSVTVTSLVRDLVCVGAIAVRTIKVSRSLLHHGVFFLNRSQADHPVTYSQ